MDSGGQQTPSFSQLCWVRIARFDSDTPELCRERETMFESNLAVPFLESVLLSRPHRLVQLRSLTGSQKQCFSRHLTLVVVCFTIRENPSCPSITRGDPLSVQTIFISTTLVRQRCAKNEKHSLSPPHCLGPGSSNLLATVGQPTDTIGLFPEHLAMHLDE